MPFQVAYEGDFNAHVLLSFAKKFIFELVTRIRTPDSTVFQTCQPHAGRIIRVTSETAKRSLYRWCVAVIILQIKYSLLSGLLKPQLFALTVFLF